MFRTFYMTLKRSTADKRITLSCIHQAVMSLRWEQEKKPKKTTQGPCLELSIWPWNGLLWMKGSFFSCIRQAGPTNCIQPHTDCCWMLNMPWLINRLIWGSDNVTPKDHESALWEDYMLPFMPHLGVWNIYWNILLCYSGMINPTTCVSKCSPRDNDSEQLDKTGNCLCPPPPPSSVSHLWIYTTWLASHSLSLKSQQHATLDSHHSPTKPHSEIICSALPGSSLPLM